MTKKRPAPSGGGSPSKLNEFYVFILTVFNLNILFSLFETSQSLFWASFGLVDLVSFDLAGIKSFTRFWALLMFGSYSVINIIVLLNMLIAMMSNSYQIISERADTEWKFARSQLWMSYFEDGGTIPPPFNLCPNMKMLRKTLGRKRPSRTKSFMVGDWPKTYDSRQSTIKTNLWQIRFNKAPVAFAVYVNKPTLILSSPSIPRSASLWRRRRRCMTK